MTGWTPEARAAAAAKKQEESQGSQQTTQPRQQAQPTASDYGQAHGLPMQHGQGGRLHMGTLGAAALGTFLGLASAIVKPALMGGGGMGGGGMRRGRR